MTPYGPDWPLSEEEYALAHFAALMPMLLVVLLLDAGSRHLTKQLSSGVSLANSCGAARESELRLLVWHRLQGELTVLTCVSILSWVANRCELLEMLAAAAAKWPRADESAPTSAWWAPSFVCHPRMPPDAASLLSLATDVSFALLLSVVLYFGFVALVLHTMQQWLSGYRRLEAGGPPLNPAEHFALRQLDAMRSQLLGAMRAEAHVQKRLQTDGALAESVDRRCLYVSHFISEVRASPSWSAALRHDVLLTLVSVC